MAATTSTLVDEPLGSDPAAVAFGALPVVELTAGVGVGVPADVGGAADGAPAGVDGAADVPAAGSGGATDVPPAVAEVVVLVAESGTAAGCGAAAAFDGVVALRGCAPVFTDAAVPPVKAGAEAGADPVLVAAAAVAVAAAGLVPTTPDGPRVVEVAPEVAAAAVVIG